MGNDWSGLMAGYIIQITKYRSLVEHGLERGKVEGEEEAKQLPQSPGAR